MLISDILPNPTRRIRTFTVLIRLSLLALSGFCLSYPCAAQRLIAGARRVEITPPSGAVSMWGYGAWNNPELAQGALDPLYAHVLYMRGANGEAFAWVDLDCGRTPGIPTQEVVRRRVRQLVPHVFFSATHTHSGPFFRDDLPGAPVPSWEQVMIQRIVGAIEEAVRNAIPVKIGFAYGSALIGYNRRLVRADGSVTMLSGIDGNRERLAKGPLDSTFAVLRLDDEKNGEPVAIIINATAHPVIRQQRNLFSADYPGVVRRVVSAGFASRPVCFFLQGGAGDINPKRPLGANPEADDGVEQLGELLGEHALTAAHAVTSQVPRDGNVKILFDRVQVHNRWPHADFERTFSDFRGYVDHLGSLPELPLAVILIDGDIGWAAFPGEFFVELQMRFRARSPLAQTLFAGYSNGYFGYFPTIEAAAEGGYGANNIMASVEVGAGERMINQALVGLNRLLGRLRDTPVSRGEPYAPTWKRP